MALAQEEDNFSTVLNSTVTIGNEFVVAEKTILVKDEYSGEMVELSPGVYEVRGTGLIRGKNLVFFKLGGVERRFALETLKEMGVFQQPAQPILL